MNLGLAYQTQGKLDDAVASLSRAVELAPTNAEAIYNLAVAQMNGGLHEQAMQSIVKALDKAPSTELRSLFVTCLTTMPRIPAEDRLRNLTARALTEGWSRPDQLVAVTVNILRSNPVIARAIAQVNQHWPRPIPFQDMLGAGGLAVIAQDDLLAALLQATAVTDIELERALTGLRFALLADARQSDGAAGAEKVLRLAAALAQQCFLNGYVWTSSDDEANRVRELQATVTNALQNKQPIAPQWLAAIAAYEPLHMLPIAERLAAQALSEPVQSLIERQINEPAAEAALSPSIAVIATVGDASNAAPAPRWTAITPQRPVSIDAYLRRGFPLAPMRGIGKSTALDVLIADCGTGQSAIETAMRHPASNVLAVDANIANLAYATRQTGRFGQTAIRFAVANDLGAIRQSFDVIDATAAMSQAANAETALTTLAALLQPNGVMLLSVQGESLHRAIKSGQDFVQSGNYQSDLDGIRLLRQNILKLSEGHPARLLSQRVEFYEAAACKDLLFRNQMPALVLSNAESLLAKAGLSVIGIDIDTRIGDRYRARFPDDARATNFANWQALERDNPDMAAMAYRVWVQRI